MESYSNPRFCEIRAAIGTADTPALPISGLIFLCFGKNRLKNLTNNTPEAVAMIKAKAPKAKIFIVSIVKNSLACVEHPTVRPSNMTMTSFNALPAVLAKRVVFVLSFNRLPKNNIPKSGRPEGTMKVVISKPTTGNMIFSVGET